MAKVTIRGAMTLLGRLRSPVIHGSPTTFVIQLSVTATRGERSLTSLPVSASVLEPDAIQNAPTLTTSEMLRALPSLNLSLGRADLQHPTANSASIRGLGGQRVLLLLDGVPLNDPFFGFIQWEKVPPETIERVELVRGASSSLFGSYALGGALSILTRQPAGDELGLEAGYGNLETTRLNAAGALRRGAFDLGANVNYFDTAGYVKLAAEERGAADIASAAHSLNAQTRLRYHPSDAFDAFARANYFQNRQDLETRFSENERRIFDVAAGFHRRLDADSRVSGSLFYEHNRFETTNTDFVTPDSRDEDYVSNVHETPTDDLGGYLQWSGSAGSHVPQLSAGVDFRRIDGEDASTLFAPSGEPTGTQLGRGRQRFIGLFTEASVVPATRWELLLSLRLDLWRNYSAELATGGATVFPPDRSETQLSPRLALRYQLTQLSALRGALYTGFRAPNLDNLYRPFTSSGFALIPNPDVGPETLRGAEVGYDLYRSRVHGQLNLFRSEVHDLIGSTTVAYYPVFTVRVVNIGRTRSQGAEALADAGVGSRVKLHFGYTFTDATILENPDDPSRVGQRTGGVPRHQVNVGLSYAAPSRTFASVRCRYLSDQIDDFTGGSLDAHTVVDAQVAQALGAGLELFGVVENLFDAEYVASSFGGPQLGAPRTAYLGLRWRGGAGGRP